jgi:nitrate reductase gamma subunit
MILTPLFLFAHVELWRGVLGFGWYSLPKSAADILTLVTIAAGITILLGRVGNRNARAISRKQDYFWPLVIIIPFVTGYFCANVELPPAGYQLLMLAHVLSAELIFILMPFTKLAHCVIQPLSQFIIAVAWKFPADTDNEVTTALKKKGAPV